MAINEWRARRKTTAQLSQAAWGATPLLSQGRQGAALFRAARPMALSQNAKHRIFTFGARVTMPETRFHIPAMLTEDDASAVMFELQDLPCVNQADVDLPKREAWVSHTAMISAEDIAAKLQEAGFEAEAQ
jgi:copper chaperone CopZ